MEIKEPYKVLEIVFKREYPGYIYRREITDCRDVSDEIDTIEMVNCYSSDTGEWIGGAKEARFLCNKMGLRFIQKAHPDHSACSIGINPQEQKWYGWSHRAICGFGIGDKLFEESYGDERTLFTEHGHLTITTIAGYIDSNPLVSICIE